MKPRILFVAFQSNNESNGGIDSATRMFEALREDFDWELVTNRESKFTERWRAGNAQVWLARSEIGGSRTSRYIGLIKIGVCIWRAIAKRRPDIVHVNDILSGIVAARLARHASIPLVMTVRGLKQAGESYGRRWQFVMSCCFRVVALSDEMADSLRVRLLFSSSQLLTIRSIVDLDAMSPVDDAARLRLRESLGIAPDEFAVASVGAFFPLKGQLRFIQAAVPEVLARIPDARVHFLGDFDPEEDKYSRACQFSVNDQGLSKKVKFHGHSDEIAKWYKACDVIVVHSQREGLARSMIESMACGTPVVSFNVCSATETLDESAAGIVVEQGDYDQMVSVLRELASDTARRKKIGQNARIAAKSMFSKNTIRNKYLFLYRECLSQRSI